MNQKIALPSMSGSTIVGRIAIFAAGMAVACIASAANCIDAPVSNNKYYIVNEGSGLQLDVPAASQTSGASIVQWTANNQANQQWTVSSLGNGIWTIRAAHSGQGMDASGLSAALATPVRRLSRPLALSSPSHIQPTIEGASITQGSYSGNMSQQWLLTSTTGGARKIVSNLSKKLATVADTKTGTGLQQHLDQSSAFQRWYFNPVNGKCDTRTGDAFGNFMGHDKILIGGMLDKETVKGAPFDVRYLYVHSRPAPFAACYSQCLEGCNSGPDGGWWGCWGSSSYDLTSGTYITWWNNESAMASYQQKPMIQQWTWYSLQDLAKAAGDLNKAAGGSGEPDYAGAIKNPTLLKSYIDDYRFFLNKIGKTSRTIIQLEPDFWGFVRSKGAPHAVPAAVRAASGADCASEEDSAAGLASCLINMARAYAPASTVGLHTSCWDWDRPDSPTEGPKACTAYYRELGAGKGDFIASDAADRDAAWAVVNDPVWGPRYWWDDAKFTLYLNLIKTLTEGVGKPMVIWQIPLGNEWQDNTVNNWKDNKVWYMFDRINNLADVHVAALLFGAGHHEQTSTETDDHYMLYKAQEYYRNGGVRMR